jgi:aspartate/methionine/tyrosine aminotransferase
MIETSGAFTPSRMVRDLVARSPRPAVLRRPDVIPLGAGDPDFATPEPICRALEEALREGATHYVHLQGDPELRQALADRLSSRAGRAITADQILITHGGSAALSTAILATVDQGQRVVLPDPTYSLYADAVWMAGGEVTFVGPRPDWHLDLDAIAAAAPGARLLVICSPCNPTGAVYTREELEGLARIAAEHDLWVLSDEAYDHIVFDRPFTSALEVEGLAERLLYVQTFSKTYAMTGWRLGYVAAPAAAVEAVARLHRTLNGSMNAAVQRAALAALQLPEEVPELMRREYQRRRDLVCRLLEGAPGVELHPPEGAFYAFIRHRPGISSEEVRRRALDRGVAVRAGSEYGPHGEGYVRVAFSGDPELVEEGVIRLRQVLAEQ